MNLRLIFFSIVVLISFDIQGQDLRKDYLVERMANFQGETIGEYLYNEDNQLIRRIYKFLDDPDALDKDSLIYEDGRVSKIERSSRTIPSYDYDIHIFYDSTGTLVRKESQRRGLLLDHENYYYEDGKVVSVYLDGQEPFETDTIKYDENGNIYQWVKIIPKMGESGNPIPGKFEVIRLNYEYDDNPKPYFGIDEAFVYTAIVRSSPSMDLIRGLSINNPTRAHREMTTFKYTVYENGLLKTMDELWDNITITDSIAMTFHYKPLVVSNSKQKRPSVSVFPNPFSQNFTIDYDDYDMLKIFDITNKLVHSQAKPKDGSIDLSHLQSGIYMVSLISENKVIAVEKVVKNY